VPVWSLFELLNFRLQNWFYVNAPESPLHGMAMTGLAYATVLPGLFETYDLLGACRVLENVRTRPWRVTPGRRWLSVALGAGMLGLALAWPGVAFPLVWLFGVLVVDPLCHRWGARSLLGQLEQGDPRPALRLLLAGLICGGLWELWNFWAHARWVYTVPYFEDTKWFEMPPLGFLGFPPFALECYAIVNLLSAFRRGRGWEAPEDAARPGATPAVAAAAVAGAAVFSLAVWAGIDRFTVESRSPELRDIHGLRPAVVESLARAGIGRPHALVRAGGAERLASLSRATGIEPSELRAAVEAARLVDTKGLGSAHHDALRALGITSVRDLAAQDPAELHRRWVDLGVSRPPRLAQVRIWVRAARHTPG
jgi:predicted flap endonuclease-1-like 5' DNA nuclease